MLGAFIPVFASGGAGSMAEGETSDSVIDLTGRGEGYTSVLYDSAKGLPTSEANAVVQSPDGFIWIGGYSGLVRYDGNEFKRYDSTYGVTSVMCLFVDSKERLWIGTNDNGAAMLEGDTITFFNGEGVMNSSYVRVISEDKDGNILIGTTMGIVYIDSEGVMRKIDDERTNGGYIEELIPGADGLVYGDTFDGDVFTIKELGINSFLPADSLDFDTVKAVCPDPEAPGYAYLGTRSSEVRYGSIENGFEGSLSYSIKPHGQANCLRVFNGSLWVCADNGVGFLKDGKYVALENLPMDNSIDNIMADFEGNLWFTSSRQGVMKITRDRFVDLNTAAHIEKTVVNSTHVSDGLLYIGTDSGLLIIDSGYNAVENAVTQALSGVRIRCIREDSHGFIWFCTYGRGLYGYNAKSGELTVLDEDTGLASNRTRSIMELNNGWSALATNAGVNLISEGRIIATLDHNNGISNTQILCIEEGADGRLYLGSDGDGIYVISAAGTNLVRIGKENGLKSEVILRIKRDPVDERMFWIITSNSMAWMKDGVVTTVESFPYSNNFDIYFDALGRAWVLSSNGVYVAARSSLLEKGRLEYTFYDRDCGLPHISTANSFSYLSDDGTLYMACSTGVAKVNINDTADLGSEIRLAVPYLTVDDKYVRVEGGEITVPSSCKRLTVHPFAFTYSLNNPRLSYIMEGFDDQAFQVNRRELTAVTYTNLDGGSYRFVLSVVDPMTGETTQSLSINIIKEKTLTENWWFWAGITAMAVLMIVFAQFMLNKRRAAALIKKQDEQKKLINGITKLLSDCVEMKDAYTNGHAGRVAKYTAWLAEKLGKSKDEVDTMYNIALLHDVGKISIPDAVLNKPAKLTDEEFALMKSHTSRGYDMLKEIDIAPELALGAGYHHERYDGRGYPRGLKGEEIPEVARIIAVADTFDAMYSTRPYRKRMELATVVSEIEKSAGTQLAPEVVDAFIKLYREGAFDNE